MAESTARGHLLVDLVSVTLDRELPLALLPPDAAPIVPDPLPDTLEASSAGEELPPVGRSEASLCHAPSIPGPTFDASILDEERRERFHRNLRAVEQVLAGAPQTRIAAESGIPRSTLSRLVSRTRELGAIACVPMAATPAHLACTRLLPSASVGCICSPPISQWRRSMSILTSRRSRYFCRKELGHPANCLPTSRCARRCIDWGVTPNWSRCAKGQRPLPVRGSPPVVCSLHSRTRAPHTSR